MPPLLRRNWATPCSPEERHSDAASAARYYRSTGFGNKLHEHGDDEGNCEECVCCGDTSTRARPVNVRVEDLDADPPLKRPRRWAISLAAASSCPAMPVDTWAAIIEYGMPSNLREWAAQQERYFGGSPVLPRGWIRCWSESRMVAYYCCLENGQTTFDWSEMTPAKADAR